MRVFSLILFQSVANFPGSKSNSKNIDPKFESSFARFLQITSYQIILSILMSNETIFIDFFQSVANFPGSKSNSKNIDPKFESSFARFFSNETIFNDFFQSLANFPAKGLLAREAKALKVLFLFS
jgi:hypothetical protein